MRVSVVIPARDAAETLGETLDSLVLQTHRAWEAVAVDDGSRDGTAAIADRWSEYIAQNGRTPIGPLARRLDLLATLDLRPALAEITTEVLILHGNEDRIVPRRYFDELTGGLPRATGVVMPMVGHQPHYTHFEALAQAIGEFCLPCRPEGDCQREAHPG